MVLQHFSINQSIKWFISDNKGPCLLYIQTDRETEREKERDSADVALMISKELNINA